MRHFIVLDSKQTCPLLYRKTLYLSREAVTYAGILEKDSPAKEKSVPLLVDVREILYTERIVPQQSLPLL